MTTALPGDPAEDRRLARIHLRMGELTLARAELEDLLGRDALDSASLAVLAEARWRTGDAAQAASAAASHLEAGGTDPVAICIAAEAAAAEGRPDDARALMDRLPNADAPTLDSLFAGMPRRAFWPAAPVDHSAAEEIRRGAAPRATEAPPGAATAGGAPAPRGAIPGPREVLEASAAGADASLLASGGRTGGGTGVAAGRGGPRAGRGRTRGALDPRAELARGREELETKPERAILRLALVLRHDPTLAPAVLEALHLRREPAAILLRGDAERLLGRHLEAEAAFDAVAETLEA